MRLDYTRAGLLVLALGALVPIGGCARGGTGRGGNDGGPVVVRDGSTDQRDTGTTPRDSGQPHVDSGPPVECAGAAECDDGLACNGAEQCVSGTCAPGTPPSCDDGVSCTRESCVEPTSGTTPSCQSVPDDSLCPSGQTCGAGGCASSCSETPCRLVGPQCGCGAGQGCYTDGTTRMCAAAGSGAEGASCASLTGCQPGLGCINVGTTASPANQCGRFCSTDADCMGSGSICIHTLTGETTKLCSRACDPITSTGCSASAACRVLQDTASGRFLTDCGAAGAGTQYDSCATLADCARGYTCVNTSFGVECLQYCRSDADCLGSEVCYPFATPQVIDGVEYGVCDI